MSLHPLRSSVRALSLKPGVYLFIDDRGSVLYVGKAQSLRKRVAQYFAVRRLDPSKREMISRARSVDTIITNTEGEALALEATLIAKHAPPYNVRLVDDSSYLYLKITNEPYPAVVLTRRVLPDGSWYRGPFPSASAIRATLKEARKLFPWCAYSGSAMQRAAHAPTAKPCFAYHLGLCPGICVGVLSLEKYQQGIECLKRFLDGDTADRLHTLKDRMTRLSATQAYEQAARLRDAIRAIERTTTPQSVVTPRRESADVVGIARRGSNAAATVLHVRHGRVTGTDTFALGHSSDEASAAVLRGFLLHYYGTAQGPLPAVLLPEPVEDQPALGAWLKQRHGPRLVLAVPRRGWKRTLVSLARTNAEEALKKALTELVSPARLHAALADLQQTLALPTLPTRIETYDISNIQGTLATGAMVVFVDGRPKRSEYRKFKITLAGTPNDVAMMKEVLRRRFERHGGARGQWPLPNFLIVDGGKGQLNGARAVLRDHGLNLPVAALAKREEELFLPGRQAPLRLPRTSPALYLLQRLRDEAHRFTLGYHQLLRKKRMTHSLLEDVPGVGDATRKKLLRVFGSLRGIREAPPADLARVVGRTRATLIRHALAPAGAPDSAHISTHRSMVEENRVHP